MLSEYWWLNSLATRMPGMARTTKTTVTSDYNGLTFHVDGAVAGLYRFTVTAFEESSGIAIVSNVWLHPSYRGKGYGREFRLTRNAALKQSGCTYQLAKVERNNAVQNHIMKMTGAIQLTRLGDHYLYGQPL